MSFSSLKKQSSLGSLTSKLVKEIEKTNTTKGGADERLWKPELDKSGNGYAVIRFLPATDGEDLPWAKVYSHAFQGPGGWYIENSLTTLGAKDPVSEYNRDLWNSGNDGDKDVVRRQKRKLSYYANIYVVKDPVNPHNEGGVFLFKFGKKIFDKLTAAMQPEFEDETPINPFDFWQGANFKLKIRKVDGYWNYDKSEFDAPSPLLDDDDALEALWKKEYPLADFTAQSNFKSYEDLERRLKSVLGQKQAQRPRIDEEVVQEDDPTPVAAAAVASAPDADEDDALSYFQKLAEE
jgi:hypothetical protein|tara:strand:- start:1016 stop:1894 length:879 start_codon:yes stop_codon:yes gene_type:complete